MSSSPEPPRKKRPGINRDLELVCMRCLEHDPENRYTSSLELANDLESWLDGRSISINPPSLTSLVGRWFRQNQRLAYGGFAILKGILICSPVALTFFADNQRDIYTHFPADQRPLLFSTTAIPQWVSVASACVLFFVLWPSIGILNAAITRPKSIFQAARLGLFTASSLALIFYVLLGWLVMTQSAVNASNDKIAVLSQAVWPPEGIEREESLAKANGLFDGVEHIPESQRAAIVAKRISSDQIASTPVAILILLIVGVIFGLPIVYGTVMGYVLLQRQTRFWICVIRYAVCWWAIKITTILLVFWFPACYF